MTHQPGAPIIQLRRVTKTYLTGAKFFTALDDIDLTICQGEFTAVVGRSGSGKSTLINMITGIDELTSGEVMVAATPIHQLNQEQLVVWRGKNVGVVSVCMVAEISACRVLQCLAQQSTDGVLATERTDQ